MKIIIFGATGTVGHLAVERILADGHEVTAFARRPNELKIKNPNVRVVAGDALDPDQVVSRR